MSESSRASRPYTTALRRAGSLNQAALSFDMRLWVLKSTYTIPNRVP